MESRDIATPSADDQHRIKAKAKFDEAENCVPLEKKIRLFKQAIKELLKVKEKARTADDWRNLAEYAYLTGAYDKENRVKYLDDSGNYLGNLPLNDAIEDWRSYAFRAQNVGRKCRDQDSTDDFYEHALNCLSLIPKEKLTSDEPVIMQMLIRYIKEIAYRDEPKRKEWVKKVERNDSPKTTNREILSSSFSAVKNSSMFNKKIDGYQELSESSEEKDSKKKALSSSSASRNK